MELKCLLQMIKIITEFTLSNPFDLSNVTSEVEKIYQIKLRIHKIAGIAFSNDGLKMFLLDFKTNFTSDVTNMI